MLTCTPRSNIPFILTCNHHFISTHMQSSLSISENIVLGSVFYLSILISCHVYSHEVKFYINSAVCWKQNGQINYELLACFIHCNIWESPNL